MAFTSINERKKEIYPLPIQVPLEKATKQSRDEFKQHQGFIPLVDYNGYQIPYESLTYFLLTIKDGLPQLKCSFIDSFNYIKQGAFPLDNTKIKIFINTRSDINKPILIQFKLISLKSQKIQNYDIVATIDLDNIYTIKYESYPKLTSFEVLKKISSNIGLGFNSNINSTNDKMNWLNYGRKLYQFLRYVVNNSYISDKDFTSYYIDYYYNLNYVNIEEELKRDISNDECVVDNFYNEALDGQKKEPKKVKLHLTTDQAQATSLDSNLYIEKFEIIQNSTKISLQEGYLKTIFYYDTETKEKLIFDLDTLTSDSKNAITMKSVGDDNFFKSNYSQEYMGKIDKDNVHQNYNYSDFQNNRNLQELDKIKINVYLPRPNFNLYVFQKIFVMFVNSDQTPVNIIVNHRLTGEYLISNISYEYSQRTFYQIVTLSARELSADDQELKNNSNQ